MRNNVAMIGRHNRDVFGIWGMDDGMGVLVIGVYEYFFFLRYTDIELFYGSILLIDAIIIGDVITNISSKYWMMYVCSK